MATFFVHISESKVRDLLLNGPKDGRAMLQRAARRAEANGCEFLEINMPLNTKPSDIEYVRVLLAAADREPIITESGATLKSRLG